LWTRQFGTPNLDTAYEIGADPTGLYVVGFTRPLPEHEDAFLWKIDRSGNVLWSRLFGTPNADLAVGIATDSTGVYVIGSTTGTLANQTSAGLSDVFIRKYDPTGAELWTRQFGTSANDSGTGIAVDASGIYITGSTGGVMADLSAGGIDVFIQKIAKQ